MLTICPIPDPDFVPSVGVALTFEAAADQKSLGRARFVLEGSLVTLFEIVCADDVVLDALTRAGFFAALSRRMTTFAIGNLGQTVSGRLTALGIPLHGRLDRFFSGDCKSTCTGDCKGCHG
ncbi:MAG: hypothetical protein RR135_00015 [Oscillospiraceae bacterium]